MTEQGITRRNLLRPGAGTAGLAALGTDTEPTTATGTAGTEGSDGTSDGAGDRVTLQAVPPEYDIRVVWRSSDDGYSATLAAAEGPAA